MTSQLCRVMTPGSVDGPTGTGRVGPPVGNVFLTRRLSVLLLRVRRKDTTEFDLDESRNLKICIFEALIGMSFVSVSSFQGRR
jgi:hypothetical protein